MQIQSIPGTYGSSNTPCTVITYELNNLTWYAVEGSANVNATEHNLLPGVDVETVPDVDYFTAGETIETESDLIYWVEL